MSSTPFLRFGATAAALTLLALTTACADNPVQESEGATGNEVQHEAAPQSEDAAANEDSDEYAFGSDQDQMAEAIEAAFAADNGSATWEDTTLVLAIDGDAHDAMAGFTECRVLKELLHDDDLSVIEYPNGRVDCTDVVTE